MAYQVHIHATRYHRRARRRRRQVPTEEGGGGQSRPQSLSGCPAKPPTSSPAQIRATREERGGRWVGGNCRGPMASQAATRTLPPLPLSARPSDVHCDASTIHMHVPCARAPLPAAAPITSRCHPVRSTHGGRGFVTGAMDFIAVGEKRGEGRGAAETTQPPRLPPCHQHAASSIPTTCVAAGIMDAKIPATAKPSERCSGVIVSVLQRLPRRLHHPRGWPPHRCQSCPAQPLPRMAATTTRRLGEQSRPLGLPGYPLIHCHHLCQPRVIDGPGSDCLRCEEGGEGSYRGHLSLPGAPPALPQSPPRAPTTTIVKSGRLQPDPAS
jgi:hypothetical protein